MGEHLSGVLQGGQGEGQPDMIFAQSFRVMTGVLTSSSSPTVLFCVVKADWLFSIWVVDKLLFLIDFQWRVIPWHSSS